MTKTTVFGLTLSEADGSFRLGTDALLLSAYVKENKNAWALEMGAGSGAISLLLAKRGCFKRIHAIEVQNEIYLTMKQNIKENALDGIITPVCADIRDVNLEEYKGVSVIYANPPYMKTSSGKSSPSEMRNAARHEVYGGVSDFCRTASKILKTGGKRYLVYRPDRLETLMRSLYENGFSPKRMTFVHSDSLHAPSSLLVEAALGGKEALTLTAPFFFNANGKQSTDAEYVYEYGKFPEKYQTV
jgi:tRNA1Val (adenine37-N6)-methyltransferase